MKQTLLLLAVAILAGCEREQVQVYKVGKEQPAAPPEAQAASLPAGHPDVAGATPKLQWKLPNGWQEGPPSEMRLASFKITGPEGKQADVSIVPLGGMAGGDLANVNRWRQQVGLGPLAESDLPQQAQALEIGGQPAQLYDLAGQNPSSGEKTRILAAVSHRNGTAWFFKMTGDDQLVAQQKPNFVQFLKSLTFPVGLAAGDLPPSHPPISDSGVAAPLTAAPASAEGKPTWQVPQGWQEVPGGQFLVAKFNIAGTDPSQTAAVNVSRSVGTGGGMLANVNRWRGQLVLAPLADADLAKESKTLEVTGGQATLVDMSGTDARTAKTARLVGAIVPQGDQTWFYKLMGSSQVVEQQKEAFTQFVQKVKYAP